MRKLGLSFIALLFAIGIATLSLQRSNISESLLPNSPAVLGHPAKKNQLFQDQFEYKGQNLSFALLKVDESDSISLHSNLDDMLTTTQLMQVKTCQSFVNTGFYTKENTHIGLYISDFTEIQIEKESELFDGFLSVNDFGTKRITRIKPRDNLRLAVQSGPILVENGSKINLSIRNDNSARRVIAATTGDNQLVFLAIYDTNSKFEGPLLGDLPGILSLVQERADIEFADAINLDGGAASAFYSQDFKLTEASLIGGYFCIN